MMIKTIEIKNIKGIGDNNKSLVLQLNITPNKPTIFVASNGFGKSSIAIAFKSLQNNKIKLNKLHCHHENERLNPELKIIFNKNGSDVELIANSTINTIKNEFDYFVINSGLRAKGYGQRFGDIRVDSASMIIDEIKLVNTIPDRVEFDYNYSIIKRDFGLSGKILPNINRINKIIFSKLKKHYTDLNRANGQKIQNKIQSIVDKINSQSSRTKEQIINWIKENIIQDLRDINYLNSIANTINNTNFNYDKEVESYLIAYQLIILYNQNPTNFKKYCNYQEYLLEKKENEELFQDFNTTWYEFKPKKRGNSLILDFPKTHLISNGQRDIMNFIALLKQAEKKLKKQNNILIIDEIFDYLDDANLVVAQYYISKLIQRIHKKNNHNIYPIIMTHLDPMYFRGFVFNRKKLKIIYLEKSNLQVNHNLVKLLKERNNKDSTIKTDIEKYLLHYHTEPINKKVEFRARGLKETWGEGYNFDKYINDEIKIKKV